MNPCIPMTFLFPAIAACLYAFGSLGLKTAMQRGAASRRVMKVSNLAMALWSLPIFFFGEIRWDLQAWFIAVLAGGALFTGRFFAIKALEHGDLSVVVPLLGMKTVLVALLSKIFFPFELSNILILCAALASGGIYLLQKGPESMREGNRKAMGFAMGASLLFAITDISMQGSREALGSGVLVPTLFLTVGVLVPLLGRTSAPPRESNKPLLAGSAVIGFQTTLMIVVISLVGQATLINVVYASRALWSVVVDMIFGGQQLRQVWGTRLLGASMICGAVVLAILSKL